MIGDVLQIASTSLIAASTAAETYATNIANLTTPSYPAQDPVFSPLNTGGVAVFVQDTAYTPDPLTQALGMISAANQYKAAATLVSTGLDLNATLLQTIA